MVRRHWVRGHFRGGDKAVGWAFITCFIVGCLLFLAYDSLRDWRYAGAAWWALAGAVGLCVVLCVAAAGWWTIHRWRRNLALEEAKRHRPRGRSSSARAVNNVQVNVLVSPDVGRASAAGARRRTKSDTLDELPEGEDFPR